MLNCLIVDDEPLARRQIAAYVENVPFLNLVSTARNPVVAQAILQTEAIDLIFLDIKMPHQNGIEFLKQREVFQQVIFITAYPEYAIEGFELSVTDYLMKPVTFERFYKACEKARMKIAGSANVKVNTEQQYIYVKCNQRLERIFIKDILFVEAMLNYVNILTDSTRYTVYLSLKSIGELLPDEQFTRIHKSYIVSNDRVDTIENHRVHIAGHAIPIGRTNKEFLKKLRTMRS